MVIVIIVWPTKRAPRRSDHRASRAADYGSDRAADYSPSDGASRCTRSLDRGGAGGQR